MRLLVRIVRNDVMWTDWSTSKARLEAGGSYEVRLNWNQTDGGESHIKKFRSGVRVANSVESCV